MTSSSDDSKLLATIRELSERWPVLTRGGDPNPSDILWLAKQLVDRLSVELPPELPSEDVSLELVESVEEDLIQPSRNLIVRFSDPAVVEEACQALTRLIKSRELLSYDDRTNLVAALATWYGCLSMAKPLRERDSQGAPYTDQVRLRDYGLLANEYELQMGSIGRWIRNGSTLARPLEVERGNQVIDAWVPQDSPYWQG
jgi:hypothetical protein